jgi:hypothetical protein
MMVLYGYWQQLYSTVWSYTAGGRIIISWTNRLRRGCHACILWSMSLRTAQDTPYTLGCG